MKNKLLLLSLSLCITNSFHAMDKEIDRKSVKTNTEKDINKNDISEKRKKTLDALKDIKKYCVEIKSQKYINQKLKFFLLSCKLKKKQEENINIDYMTYDDKLYYLFIKDIITSQIPKEIIDNAPEKVKQDYENSTDRLANPFSENSDKK